MGSVLIWLGFCVLFAWSALFPSSMAVRTENCGQPRILPDVTESSFSLPIKHVFVFDDPSHYDEEAASFDFRKHQVSPFLALSKEEKSIAVDGLCLWSNRCREDWVSMNIGHHPIHQLRVINDIQWPFVSGAFGFRYEGGCQSVRGHSEFHGVKGLAGRQVQRFQVNSQPCSLFAYEHLDVLTCDIGTRLSGVGANFRGFSSNTGKEGLPSEYSNSNSSKNHLPPFGPLEGCVPRWRVAIGAISMVGGIIFALRTRSERRFFGGLGIFAGGVFVWTAGHKPCKGTNEHYYNESDDPSNFHANNVTQKLLTTPYYCNTLIAIGRLAMANILSTDKQIAVVSALAEGSSIRSIERITGVHRDTIMRLGVRVGKGCARVLDAEMRNLPYRQLQFDELWGFIGKKERHCTPEDSPELGDVWTFCAIDAETKIVPSFKVGKRDLPTANAFVADVASRMRNRVQISSDALRAYVDAVETNFGADVDFAQIIKTYVTDHSKEPERRFSAPEIVITEKKRVSGFPDLRLASTSHVERLNGTTRLHMRRLTRLTYAFSKKLDNFQAAVALHFAYYNFVKRHNTLRATPAMAAGISRDFWSVGKLIEAAA